MGQPVEEGITDELGEEQTHGELHPPGDPQRADESDRVSLSVRDDGVGIRIFFLRLIL